MSYKFDLDDAIGLAHTLGAEYQIHGDEMQWKLCPYCNGGAHNDEESFSINIKSGAFLCLRSSCGMSGHFAEMARDFNYRLDNGISAVYVPLPQPKEPIVSRDSAIEYMKSRGISEEITKRYSITAQSKNPDVIVFPFFDETGKLQFVKYRNSKFRKGMKGNKEWCEANAMPILFGMYQCKDFDRLIITEGQIDSLSVAQAGFDNAVSVPTGAKGMTWFPPCQEWISKFKEVIIFGDCEKGHITLVDELKARLPQAIKVVRMQDYLGEKDANDILRTYGVKAIQKCIENAREPSIECVKDMASVDFLDINSLDKVATGIAELDKTLGGGVCVGQMVLVTGKRGEGKSTFLSQVECNALEAGERVFIYSGELPDFNVKYWMDSQLAGASHMDISLNQFGGEQYTIHPEALKKINEWYRGRCYIYDNNYVYDKESELESLIETVEKVIRQYSVRVIGIDNLMTAMDTVTEQDNLYLAQSNFVGALKKLAMRYKVIIYLVAHPRKSQNGFTNDDVSGSSDITNKVDIVLNYGRDAADSRKSYLQVTKNRLFGNLRQAEDSIRLRYSSMTKRIFGEEEKTIMQYGWEREEFTAVGEDELPF